MGTSGSRLSLSPRQTQPRRVIKVKEKKKDNSSVTNSNPGHKTATRIPLSRKLKRPGHNDGLRRVKHFCFIPAE